jgi:predicted transcriptional regulator
MTDTIRFSNTLTVRCQPELNARLERAARARGSKASEYVRQALRKALELDGVAEACDQN